MVEDSEYKPTANQITARLEAYEQKNGILAALPPGPTGHVVCSLRKMAKIMKDTMPLGHAEGFPKL